ncbi:MAG: Coenzyme F420 hydrogenase/dehydrogenase, beta subunit C-terminal domain [Bacteroidales bacterium]|nr:Coenzyme F420 hydrogenase/dehydrogenase, beta subunit C-terminal domain [Candidatus Physcocola equi]
MISIEEKKQCSGCTACANICSQNAISMVPDDMGFLYPLVIKSLCVNCGLCEKVCQFHPGYLRYDNFDTPIVFSGRLKKTDELARSQSGGAFFAIADHLIKNGGVVYGAAFKETWCVTHQRAADKKQLETLRMTKYVQSDVRGVYSLVKDDLKKGLIVLFSGTACQVAGLKSYIPVKYHDNLFCIDIICHGVPSPKIWQDYIEYIEDRYKSRIIKACFRDKRFGWHGARESYLLEDGREVYMRTNNYLYFNGYTLRDSCSSCVFTNTMRVGDITVGDLWGLPKDSLYEKDAKGVSLILVNSEKGNKLYEKIKHTLYVKKVNVNHFLQPQLQYPSEINPKRDFFLADYRNKGFEYVAHKYGNLGWRYRLKKLIYSIINIIRL